MLTPTQKEEPEFELIGWPGSDAFVTEDGARWAFEVTGLLNALIVESNKKQKCDKSDLSTA